jgi:hypothetical protein
VALDFPVFYCPYYRDHDGMIAQETGFLTRRDRVETGFLARDFSNRRGLRKKPGFSPQARSCLFCPQET